MFKRTVLPALFVVILAACGKEEPTPVAAPEAVVEQTPAPATSAPAASSAPAATETLAVADAATGEAATGEAIYKKTCFMCHGTGTAGAPMLGDKVDWAPRIAKGDELLLKHAIEGFTGEKGTMPAKGGNAALSDVDVKAALDYMVSKAG